MNRRVLVLGSLLLALPAMTLAQSEPQDAVEYDIFVDCPSSQTGLCPIEAWDGADALGAPAIAVDPDNVDNMIIASLHNGRSSTGAENRSRGNSQPFTTHTSTNHGASWLDNPYSPPGDIPTAASGEHPGIALDPYGHVFISSLYSIAPDSETDDWRYVIAAQKFSSLQDINSNQDGSYNVDYIETARQGNRIAQTWFTYDPVSEKVVLLWSEGPLHPVAADTSATGAVGQAAALLEELLDPVRSATAARDADEGAPEQAAPGTAGGVVSAISWVWTGAQVSDPYHGSSLQRIEPCSASTNPVASEGWMYVGCQVAEGEGTPAWNEEAQPGEVHMFRFRPAGGAPEYIGPAPLAGGAPKLGVRSDGRMALMTADVFEEETGARRVRLDGAYGQYDPKSGLVTWGEPHEYGPQLQILYANMPLVEANIQDMIYREYSGVIHLILKRVADWPEDGPGTSTSYKPAYSKAIVAIDEHYGLLEEIDLRIGDLAKRQKDGVLFGYPESLYNDLSDDFLELPPAPFDYQNRPLGDQYQREFYAVGNYGYIDFAELIEVTELRGPASVGLPNPPPPPNPAPATSSSLALGIAGSLTSASIVAVTAASMKRKSTVRAGRKKKT